MSVIDPPTTATTRPSLYYSARSSGIPTAAALAELLTEMIASIEGVANTLSLASEGVGR